MKLIDGPFLRLRSSAFCYRFTLFTRILLAAAFIPTGMVKLMGQRFTLISPEHPIGAFFEAHIEQGGCPYAGTNASAEAASGGA